MAAKEKPFKIPVQLGACADLIYQLRETRLGLERQAELVKKNESLVREYIIATLPKSEAMGVAGKVCRVTVKTKTVPQVKDWDKVYKFIKENDAFDLLQRRLSDAAVSERWDDDVEIPGVEEFTAVTLSMNKV